PRPQDEDRRAPRAPPDGRGPLPRRWRARGVRLGAARRPRPPLRRARGGGGPEPPLAQGDRGGARGGARGGDRRAEAQGARRGGEVLRGRRRASPLRPWLPP